MDAWLEGGYAVSRRLERMTICREASCYRVPPFLLWLAVSVLCLGSRAVAYGRLAVANRRSATEPIVHQLSALQIELDALQSNIGVKYLANITVTYGDRATFGLETLSDLLSTAPNQTVQSPDYWRNLVTHKRNMLCNQQQYLLPFDFFLRDEEYWIVWPMCPEREPLAEWMASRWQRFAIDIDRPDWAAAHANLWAQICLETGRAATIRIVCEWASFLATMSLFCLTFALSLLPQWRRIYPYEWSVAAFISYYLKWPLFLARRRRALHRHLPVFTSPRQPAPMAAIIDEYLTGPQGFAHRRYPVNIRPPWSSLFVRTDRRLADVLEDPFIVGIAAALISTVIFVGILNF